MNGHIYKERSGEPCDVCEEAASVNGETLMIEAGADSIRLCADCAKLAGQIGEEIEPSGGGAA